MPQYIYQYLVSTNPLLCVDSIVETETSSSDTYRFLNGVVRLGARIRPWFRRCAARALCLPTLHPFFSTQPLINLGIGRFSAKELRDEFKMSSNVRLFQSLGLGTTHGICSPSSCAAGLTFVWHFPRVVSSLGALRSGCSRRGCHVICWRFRQQGGRVVLHPGERYPTGRWI